MPTQKNQEQQSPKKRPSAKKAETPIITDEARGQSVFDFTQVPEFSTAVQDRLHPSNWQSHRVPQTASQRKLSELEKVTEALVPQIINRTNIPRIDDSCEHIVKRKEKMAKNLEKKIRKAHDIIKDPFLRVGGSWGSSSVFLFDWVVTGIGKEGEIFIVASDNFYDFGLGTAKKPANKEQSIERMKDYYESEGIKFYIHSDLEDEFEQGAIPLFYGEAEYSGRRKLKDKWTVHETFTGRQRNQSVVATSRRVAELSSAAACGYVPDNFAHITQSDVLGVPVETVARGADGAILSGRGQPEHYESELAWLIFENELISENESISENVYLRNLAMYDIALDRSYERHISIMDSATNEYGVNINFDWHRESYYERNPNRLSPDEPEFSSFDGLKPLFEDEFSVDAEAKMLTHIAHLLPENVSWIKTTTAKFAPIGEEMRDRVYVVVCSNEGTEDEEYTVIDPWNGLRGMAERKKGTAGQAIDGAFRDMIYGGVYTGVIPEIGVLYYKNGKDVKSVFTHESFKGELDAMLKAMDTFATYALVPALVASYWTIVPALVLWGYGVVGDFIDASKAKRYLGSESEQAEAYFSAAVYGIAIGAFTKKGRAALQVLSKIGGSGGGVPTLLQKLVQNEKLLSILVDMGVATDIGLRAYDEYLKHERMGYRSELDMEFEKEFGGIFGEAFEIRKKQDEAAALAFLDSKKLPYLSSPLAEYNDLKENGILYLGQEYSYADADPITQRKLDAIIAYRADTVANLKRSGDFASLALDIGAEEEGAISTYLYRGGPADKYRTIQGACSGDYYETRIKTGDTYKDLTDPTFKRATVPEIARLAAERTVDRLLASGVQLGTSAEGITLGGQASSRDELVDWFTKKLTDEYQKGYFTMSWLKPKAGLTQYVELSDMD